MSRSSATTLVTKLANAEDEVTKDAYEIFRFQKVGGGSRSLRIDRDKARDPTQVCSLLIKKNADLPYDQEEARSAVEQALKSEPSKRIRYAARLGWRSDRRRFITPRGPIGARQKVELRPPLWLNDRQHVEIGRQGNKRGWIKHVAEPCGFSNSAMLVVSAAFAAPLLEFVGLQSFGINLFGKSKVGKTAELLAAASMVGIGRESQLPNFASTSAATAELARVFNDVLLPANEVGLLAGKKRDAYAPLRELTYRLSEGRDRSRHSASIFASSVKSARFRTIFVSTAEHSFTEYAAFAGETRDEGEYARCLDVPATSSKRSTIMDRYPEENGKARWARKQLIELRNACEDQHGMILRPYIEFLIEKSEGLRDEVQAYMDEFLAWAEGHRLEGALEHAARNMALVFAGGRLGIDAGLLPWEPDGLLKAISSCFERALAHINHHESAPQRAQEILRAKLGQSDIVRRKDTSCFSEKDHQGFYEKTKNGRRSYTIYFQAFRDWFDRDNAAFRAALRWLEEKGFLHPKATDKAMPKNALDRIQQTCKWPNGKSVRSIVFDDPFYKAE